MPNSRWVAILQALLVTFLWSTSWVLIKIGLNDEEIPSMTFAGLRYSVAWLCLVGFGWRSGHLGGVKKLTLREWGLLAALGIIYITITQGTQFVALDYLPAVMLSLILNFSALFIAFFGIFFLAEYPSRIQWLGVVVFLIGVLVYFYPIALPRDFALGLAIGFMGVIANAVAGVQGRYINHHLALPAFTVTVVSMGVGAALMLGVGLMWQGLPAISLTGWLIILWLAVVNTAFAFTVWNHTLRTLSAVESGVINNTMLIQIALLAWLFLGEGISTQESIGIVAAAAGILIVQVVRR